MAECPKACETVGGRPPGIQRDGNPLLLDGRILQDGSAVGQVEAGFRAPDVAPGSFSGCCGCWPIVDTADTMNQKWNRPSFRYRWRRTGACKATQALRARTDHRGADRHPSGIAADLRTWTIGTAS